MTATDACRRDIARDLLADLRRLDRQIKDSEAEMRDALAATGTTLSCHGQHVAAGLPGVQASGVRKTEDREEEEATQDGESTHGAAAVLAAVAEDRSTAVRRRDTPSQAHGRTPIATESARDTTPDSHI
ncbi:hypothetical protein ACIQCF_36525 [Streptomyces sp. NPDC088353]|uniref:hypothetical protein n=1 Tax=unclassified Streptomyces TaxID=2593676 RepID=UPI00368CFDE1